MPRSQLIAAQYARVGATTAHLEVAGARSIYENFEGEPNAQEVAEAWKNEGFKGCWVIAMGTNEAANVAAGSNFTYDDRIESMMSTIGDEPVMWVNVKSLVPSGPYAETNMAELGQGAARSLRPLPQHAHLQLGRRRQGQHGSSPTASTSPPKATPRAAA